MVDAGEVLDALGEPNRRRLLVLLHERQEATVNQLVEASGLRQPQVSKHLRVLADAALVSARADGRYRRYRLDERGLRTAHDWFGSFEDVWQARFDALDELVSLEPGQPGRSGRSEDHPSTHLTDPNTNSDRSTP